MDFNDALVACGIDPGSVDRHKIGEWQRLPTQDHPRKKNGAVHMYESDPPAAFVQNWATGISAYAGGSGWFNSRATPSSASKKLRRARRHSAQRGWDTTEYDVALETGIELESLRRASPTHPYLTRKKIKPHGIYQKFQELIVPLRTRNGTVWSYQRICADGSKFFRQGGRTKDCYFPIGGPPEESLDRLIVCEGFATGCSLYEATGIPVAVAFTAGNLVNVAVDFANWNLHPSTIVIAADNDSQTEGNPGLSFAHDAASRCDGIVICPNFGDAARTKKLSDWNDMSVEYGPEFCRTEVERLLEQFNE